MLYSTQLEGDFTAALLQQCQCCRSSFFVPPLEFSFEKFSEAAKANEWFEFLLIESSFYVLAEMVEDVEVDLRDLPAELLICDRASVLRKRHEKWAGVVSKIAAGTQIAVNFPALTELLRAFS